MEVSCPCKFESISLWKLSEMRLDHFVQNRGEVRAPGSKARLEAHARFQTNQRTEGSRGGAAARSAIEWRCAQLSRSRVERAGWVTISTSLASILRNNGSILPEPVEAVGAQLGIPHRVHDVAVAQKVLQRAGIDAVIG